MDDARAAGTKEPPREADPTRARLATAFEEAPACIAIVVGPDHVFEMANPSYRELVGERELIGRPAREVLPELEEQGHFERLDRVFRTGVAFVGTEVPVKLRRTPGAEPEERVLNFVYQPLADADGRVTGILAHGVDVTELVRERASAEMARSLLEAVIRQMPSAVIVAEAPSGRVVLGNDRVDAIWGFPMRTPDGTADPDRYRAFHADGTPYRRDEWPLERALRGELVMDAEMVIARPDGSRGAISVGSAPVRDREGRVVAAVAIFDDVTEARAREAEDAFLAEAEHLLASSLDYQETLRTVARLAVPRLADWCAVDVVEGGVGERLAVVHADPAKEEMAREAMRRWPLDPAADVGAARVLRTGEPVLVREVTEEVLRAVARDEENYRALAAAGMRSGMIVPLTVHGRTLGALTFVSAESGRRFGDRELALARELAARAAVAVDNARLYLNAGLARVEAERAQQRAEEGWREAEAANRAKSEFLATMSHEIRTPINAIIGYTDLLEIGIAGPLTDGQRSQLKRIHASSQHLLGLIEDVLDLAKVESGRLEVHAERGRVADSVSAALALVGPQAASREIAVEEACSSRPDVCYVGDRDRVRQILVNVIGNAVKFTPRGGRIRVSCGYAAERAPTPVLGEDGSWAWVSVTDTGIGIAPDQVDRIFRPFEQAQGGYTRETGGTGLGLAISRELATLMGGDITVESTPGEGSTFTLWLPRDETDRGTAGSQRSFQGYGAVGRALLSELSAIQAAYRTRLRATLPAASGLADAELEDHGGSFLADLAATLISLERSGRHRAQLLRDGSEIQAVVAELHGRQRAQLGWSEEDVRQDFAVLWTELEAVIRRVAPGLALDPESALEPLRQSVERAAKISLRAYRGATTGAGRAEAPEGG